MYLITVLAVFAVSLAVFVVHPQMSNLRSYVICQIIFACAVCVWFWISILHVDDSSQNWLPESFAEHDCRGGGRTSLWICGVGACRIVSYCVFLCQTVCCMCRDAPNRVLICLLRKVHTCRCSTFIVSTDALMIFVLSQFFQEGNEIRGM